MEIVAPFRSCLVRRTVPPPSNQNDAPHGDLAIKKSRGKEVVKPRPLPPSFPRIIASTQRSYLIEAGNLACIGAALAGRGAML